MVGIILSGILLTISISAFIINKKIKIKETDYLSLLAAVSAGIIFICSSFHIVPPGHRGIQTVLGNMNMEPLDEGFQFINPLSSVQDVSIQNRVDSDKHECETSDTQTINIEVSYNWRPNPKTLAVLYKENGGKDFASIIIPPAIKECVKAEIARFKVSQITALRHQIKDDIFNSVKEWLAKYNIELLEMSVAGIDFSEKYDKAIEEKQVAEQEAQKALNILQRMKTEAEQVTAKAKGDADARIENARGEAESAKIAAQARADALLIEGEAQAEYNKRVAESLTASLIHRMWIERWNGILPHFMTTDSNNANFLIPIQTGNK